MSPDNVGAVRSILFWTLLLSLIAAGAELTLLGHIKGFAQLIPVVLVMAATLTLSWFAINSGGAPLRLFQILMFAFLAAGILGSALHFRGNIKREREKEPLVQGVELFQKGFIGESPALAPGVMIQIGLVGLAFTWRHPALKE